MTGGEDSDVIVMMVRDVMTRRLVVIGAGRKPGSVGRAILRNIRTGSDRFFGACFVRRIRDTSARNSSH